MSRAKKKDTRLALVLLHSSRDLILKTVDEDDARFRRGWKEEDFASQLVKSTTPGLQAYDA